VSAIRTVLHELLIVRVGFESGHGAATAAFLGCLLFAFFGLTRLVFAITDGRPRQAARENASRFRETAGVIVPPLVLLVFFTVAWARDTFGVARRLDCGRACACFNAMSTTQTFAMLGNASSLPWAEVPEWPVAAFVEDTATELERGARLCAWFGVADGDATRLVAVLGYDIDNTLAVGRSEPVKGTYPSLTPRCAQAHLFEREVWEQHWLQARRSSLAQARAPRPRCGSGGGRFLPSQGV